MFVDFKAKYNYILRELWRDNGQQLMDGYNVLTS